MNRISHLHHPDAPDSRTRALCGWMHRPVFAEDPSQATCQKCQQLRERDGFKRARLQFRASFEGVKQGPLNPAGFTARAAVNVEVLEGKIGEWYSRNADTKQPFGKEAHPNQGEAQDAIARHFERRISEWQIWADGHPVSDDEVKIQADGKAFVKVKPKPITPATQQPQPGLTAEAK